MSYRSAIYLALLLSGAASVHSAGSGDGLVAYYPLDGSGADLSGQAQHAIAVGNVGYAPGIQGQSLYLPGDAHLEVPYGPALDSLTDALSIVFWLKADESGGSLPSILLIKRMPWEGDQFLGDKSVHFGLCLGGNGNLYFIWSRWGDDYPGYSLFLAPEDAWPTMNDGAWHQIAVTHRYSSTEDPILYLDGQRLPGSYQWNVGNGEAVVRDSKLWIGSQEFGGGPYRGYLDEIRIYDRRLSDAEIQALYRPGLSLAPARLWVGLKNSDDQGTPFDLRAELFKNGSLIASGVTPCVTGVARNPGLAKEVLVAFADLADDSVSPGDELSLRMLARIGTRPDGARCPGHASATGLRLYYDAAGRPSRLGIAAPPGEVRDYFLRTDGSSCRLDVVAPISPAAAIRDSGPVKYAGGNLWSVIGSCGMTVQ
jgi:hypothetical protein